MLSESIYGMRMSEKSTKKKHYSRISPLGLTSLNDENDAETGDEFENNVNVVVNSNSVSAERYALFTSFHVTAMVLSSTFSLISFAYILDAIMELTNRWYFCAPSIFLQFLEKSFVYYIFKRVYVQRDDNLPHQGCFLRTIHDNGSNNFRFWQMFVFFLEMVTISCISVCYVHYIPQFVKDFVDSLFTGPDGVPSLDWDHELNDFRLIALYSKTCGILFFFSASFGLAALYYFWKADLSTHFASPATASAVSNQFFWKIGNLLKPIQFFAGFSLLAMGALLAISLISAWTYLLDHPLPTDNTVGPSCDPVDPTECLLPFPSSFFTVEDKSTDTGIRVNIQIDSLASMYRGRNPKQPIHYLNNLDGFSTSGPILFYVEGFKEGPNILVGPEDIELSVTEKSLTLLIDLDSRSLVHHFAEIDHLDESRPSIIVQPARSLHHNTRYAMLLVNARNGKGEYLSASQHLQYLLDAKKSRDSRGIFYRDTILPILQEVSPWCDGTTSIQMLFDFRTISSYSQLSDTLEITAITRQIVQEKKWGKWDNDKVKVVKMEDHDMCEERNDPIGRVVHGEIRVPSFLSKQHQRRNSIDVGAAVKGVPIFIDDFKFIVIVPCSIAVGSTPLKALIDFGHGFLYSREEILGQSELHRIANEEGYVYIATNWRGMSFLDLGVIVRALVSEPHILESVRDNIIQGYGYKAVVQHFVKNGLLEMNFMKFNGNSIMLEDDTPLRYLFHGISQGGILGSTYSSLLSSSGLLDGAIITSSGTPFSLIMSRSTIFPTYQRLLLMSLHHNRHIRIFLSFLQMIFDSIEVGGLIEAGQPTMKTLIQVGLGDAVVTSYSTETLARAYNASTFPSNPRQIFGLNQLMPAEATSLITEILYEQEYHSLSKTNVATDTNSVHLCTKSDSAVTSQFIDFINTGSFSDVCVNGGCIRHNSNC